MLKKIDEELKARAVRLVTDHLGEYPSVTAASAVVAKQVGVGKESVPRCSNSTGLLMAKSPVEAPFVVRAWCPGGAFDEKTRNYENNTVVYATLIHP